MGPPKCGAPGNCPVCPPLKPALIMHDILHSTLDISDLYIYIYIYIYIFILFNYVPIYIYVRLIHYIYIYNLLVWRY